MCSGEIAALAEVGTGLLVRILCTKQICQSPQSVLYNQIIKLKGNDMAESFECPKCGASLSYDSGNQNDTVKCEYCGSTVIVPNTLKRSHQRSTAPAEGQHAYSTREDETGDGKSSRLGWIIGCTAAFIIAITVLAAIIPLATGGLLFFGIFSQESERETSEQMIAQELISSGIQSYESSSDPGVEPGFASLVLEFGGEEGTGPGFFNDTRNIAVDGEGRIYTGDYQGGRIQVFDAQGAFLNLWHTGDDGSMSSMAASRDGSLYILQGEGIGRYDGVTGEFLDLLPNSEWPTFDAVAVAPS